MEQQNEKQISRAARKKMAIRAKRTQKKRERARKRKEKKRKGADQLKAIAQKKAKNILVKRMTGGQSYSSLAITAKEKIDKKLATKPGVINRIAKKLLPVVKKKELERLKRVRAKGNDKSEMTEVNQENKHGVLTLSVNGSYPEVSARYVNGNLKPYTFKSRDEAKLHCKKVGGKPFESSKTGLFYVEFTKIDGPNNMKEDKETEDNLKDLKAILDVAKMLSDKSPYFKGRGSKKEYIKMLVHKIQKLSEAKKQKLMTKMDAYKKVRKPVMPKSRPMKNKKTYDRKDLKKGRYD